MNSHDVVLIVVAVISGLPGIIAAVRASQTKALAVENHRNLSDVHHTLQNGGIIVATTNAMTPAELPPVESVDTGEPATTLHVVFPTAPKDE